MSYADHIRSLSSIYNDDMIECFICHKRFKMVCKHVRSAHGIDKRQYKMMFGLPLSAGLVGPSYRANMEKYSEMKASRLAGYIKENGRASNSGGSGYVANVCKPLRERARLSREEKHMKAAAKWASIRKEFEEMWIGGVKIETMCSRFNISTSSVRMLRNVFGLPSRVFGNWKSFYIVRGDDLPTVREAKRERFNQ